MHCVSHLRLALRRQQRTRSRKNRFASVAADPRRRVAMMSNMVSRVAPRALVRMLRRARQESRDGGAGVFDRRQMQYETGAQGTHMIRFRRTSSRRFVSAPARRDLREHDGRTFQEMRENKAFLRKVAIVRRAWRACNVKAFWRVERALDQVISSWRGTCDVGGGGASGAVRAITFRAWNEAPIPQNIDGAAPEFCACSGAAPPWVEAEVG